MQFALLSDIHANLPALEAVLASVHHRQPDQVYCLGDLGGYASQPNEVQDLLEAERIPVISGNYDENVAFDRDDCGCHYTEPFDVEMSDRSFKWTREHTNDSCKAKLRMLAKEIRFDVEGLRILLCHGSPRTNTEYLFENRSEGYLAQFTAGEPHDAHADVICFGHTHVPFHRTVNGVHFVNTGSVGRPKDGDPRAGYSILNLTAGSIEVEHVRVEYDVELTCQRLIEAGLPEYFADYLRTGGKAPKPA